MNLTRKIISKHLVEGNMVPGEEIAIKIDQTLTQDATGTMAYLEFEAMGIPRVKTELSVSYVDHNTLQTGFENADDHRFLQSAAAKFGVYFSRPGNGICHQVHLERFGVPGKTLLGSDSHTPTAGGLGMLAIGAGGLDVAMAMAGRPFYLAMPRVVNIRLHGSLPPWVSAKDIILEVLRRLTVKGGVGKVMEYGGDGVRNLSVPERATIANMGAELGATSSIFPSDDITKRFLEAQGRGGDYVHLTADADAEYDEMIDIDLERLEPLIALPHSPDNVVRVSDVAGLKVDQVFIGSCTNSSYADLVRVSKILKGKTVAPNVSLVIAPGSKQVLYMLAKNGFLADLVAAGARILECACGPCVGVGQAPPSAGVSLRTSNRNFEGRSGTKDAKVYLTSCETAAASAIAGVITDPRTLGEVILVETPEKFDADDRMIIPPPEDGSRVEIIRGPNIKPLPGMSPLPDVIRGRVLLKVGDNITTDHIMPAGAKILPLRSNIPAISEHCFEAVDPTFPERARKAGGGFIVGGSNYGQGSSREHAALAPMYLGVKAVIAKSFARIHRQNLINFGILPLVFAEERDYDDIKGPGDGEGDELAIENAREGLLSDCLEVKNLTTGKVYKVKHNLSGRQIDIILAGGLLNLAGRRWDMEK
ncbi:aconitate hydratase [Thermoanaerobacterium sp. DL9XJH110]|uniref:aconitate hydratase n=1 Tax=Thermoanaerobacterium sp. DL9XJH110 TaxID=3386643 RepID=UPI003BB54615